MIKKIKFPTAQTILFIIAGFVTLLTWIVPAGKYDTILYQKADHTFTQNSIDKSITLPATKASNFRRVEYKNSTRKIY